MEYIRGVFPEHAGRAREVAIGFLVYWLRLEKKMKLLFHLKMLLLTFFVK